MEHPVHEDYIRDMTLLIIVIFMMEILVNSFVRRRHSCHYWFRFSITLFHDSACIDEGRDAKYLLLA